MQSLINVLTAYSVCLLSCAAHAAILLYIAVMFGGTLSLAMSRYKEGVVSLKNTF
jgi:hypothetical protein